MTLKFLHDELGKILKVHEESGEARVVAIDVNGNITWPSFVGYDRRHRPPRLKLEE